MISMTFNLKTGPWGQRMLGLMFLSTLLSSHPIFSQCIDLAKGEIDLKPFVCARTDYNKHFIKDADLSFFEGFGPEDKKKFGESYHGLRVEGVVHRSKVSKLHNDNYLLGKKVVGFIPSSHAVPCPQSSDVVLRAKLREKCCSGGVEAPCLLGTSYVLTNIRFGKEKQSTAKDAIREIFSADEKKELQKLIKNKDFDLAARMYAHKSTEDVQHLYYQSMLYRKAEQFKRAIPILEKIVNQDQKSRYSAEESEKYARPAKFLLIRCYSKADMPEMAIVLLESYLAEPGRYQKEIKNSLSHEDLGNMNSYPRYNSYRVQARKALSKN